MKIFAVTVLGLLLFQMGFAGAGEALVGGDYTGKVSSLVQQEAAVGVFTRLIGSDRASQFELTIRPKNDAENDYFQIEPANGKISITAADGVSACRALKWYLNNVCFSSITWNGDNLSSLPAVLPLDFSPHRETSPYKYRYIFNNCVFGYSTPFWHWRDWERMLDVLAYNGINMPAALLGQEKVWQETYREFGLSAADLGDFFAGPAWFPWQWMGNLDGWGGPLSQEFIDKQCGMQKQILARARSLGMTPVQTGFSGHIPAALIKKHPGLKSHTLSWWGFGPTYILDWQDPLFARISSTFIRKQKEIYGTDHFYNIDPFNEMEPPSYEKEYVSSMARTICDSMLQGDPDGVWVLMTWFAKINYENAWNPERTRNFFDAIPNDHVLALELWGENWSGTGWHWQNGWYGKPWVWNILQNFGNRVDIYGGLEAIFNNYHRMLASPDHGNLQGLGIMTEGLGVNPVIYELVLDMMWGDGVANLDEFKRKFLQRRYGRDVPASVTAAWDILFTDRYNQTNLIDQSPLCFPPAPASRTDCGVVRMYDAWKLMLSAADQLKDNQAYRFDLINIGRETLSQLSSNYICAVQSAYEAKDAAALRRANAELAAFISDFDELLGTEPYFLLGKWLEDARNWASSPEEAKQLEWNAKRQITDWGGQIGYYATKEWSGMGSRALKQWEYFGKAREAGLKTGKLPADYAERLAAIYKAWTEETSLLPSVPVGDAVEVSRRMFEKYTPAIEAFIKSDEYQNMMRQRIVRGFAVNKPVSATACEPGHAPEFAVDGEATLAKGWWAPAPASLTVDLGAPQQVNGFWLTTYWGDGRCYQYTIEVSEDGDNWVTVTDNSANTVMAAPVGICHELPDGVGARYVRLNMLNNSVNSSVHVVEFKVLSAADLVQLKKENVR